MFTVNGLTDASHTLTIQLTGQMNPQATSALIVVDAFDVPAPADSRLHETDPDIAYTPGWVQGHAAYVYAASLLTGFSQGFSLRHWNDGAGQQSAASGSGLIVLEASEVTSAGPEIQDPEPSIACGAGWVQGNRDKAYSEGASAESNIGGAQAAFTFTGTGVSWIGARGPQTGIARAFLDGALMQDIDPYALTEGPQHTDFTATGLTAGTHTLTIQVLGKNPASANFWILVDAFIVVP